ncbi:MAG TPA: alpha/beta hydrolase [Noviherbaspirillum sp.]|uniref:alpha/beta fold hydrolase n=1 Tax=Noviherbaspirillum sp. TaxID=1926288 RepID=UPI002DDCF2B9|nr:alpha/beta hydrolase [Noviherbaspirillum sp.]HEV2610878.1 alpha/beta hydrolase [Noviherbaspirillum sp.]
MEFINGEISSQGGTTVESQHREIAHGWVDVSGTRTHFLLQGDGPPIVLLHGQGENAETWRWALPMLARTNCVVAPDFPGAGESAKLTTYAAPPSFYTDFLLAFLDKLGLDRVTIVGSSYGGLIAMRVALAAPNRVNALCLVDSSGLGRMTNPALTALTIPGVGEAMAAWWSTPPGAVHYACMFGLLSFAHPLQAPPAWYANMARLAQTPGHLHGAVLACLRGELDLVGQRDVVLDDVPRLMMPTLIVWGAYDAVVPSYHASAAMERLVNGRLVTIPDCGHLPHVERPDLFFAAVGDFLNEHVATNDIACCTSSSLLTLAAQPPG